MFAYWVGASTAVPGEDSAPVSGANNNWSASNYLFCLVLLMKGEGEENIVMSGVLKKQAIADSGEMKHCNK